MLDSSKLFRLKKILLLGPATIISVAYIDPGNFGSNIAAGAYFGYSLLWSVWLASLAAILLQYLAGKVGLATRKSILDLTKERIKSKALWYPYTLPMIAMILATDMAEFIGISLGLHFILGIPLILAVLISIIDVLLLMYISEKRGLFEILIGSLVAIVGISYLYELYLVKANFAEIILRSLMPELGGRQQILLIMSIIGATVMPHAVLLHSYLNSEQNKGLREHRLETIIYLLIASFINIAIQVMAYYAFYGKVEIIDMNMAYYTLIPLYGENAAYIFAIALLASGISSSIVSVLAGQRVFETAFSLKLKAWKARLLVRLINMIPLSIAVILGFNILELLVYTQAVLSLTLPFVLFPLVYFSSNKVIMQGYANRRTISFLALIFTIFVTFLNLYFFTL